MTIKYVLIPQKAIREKKYIVNVRDEVEIINFVIYFASEWEEDMRYD